MEDIATMTSAPDSAELEVSQCLMLESSQASCRSLVVMLVVTITKRSRHDLSDTGCMSCCLAVPMQEGFRALCNPLRLHAKICLRSF